MASCQHYATLQVFDEDGSVKATMPCRTEAQMVLWASRHSRVRVVLAEGVAFRLRLNPEWLEHFCKETAIPSPEDVALEHLRGPAFEESQVPPKVKDRPNIPSDQLYDGWKSRKTKY